MISPTAKRYWKWISFTVGVVFIIGGFTVGYYWFYLLAPGKHLASAVWRLQHSPRAIYEEEQTYLNRIGSLPSLLMIKDSIGYYGDKYLAIQTINNNLHNGDFRRLARMWDALQLMTNQSAQWEEWLEKHQDETQEQWLQQGFEQYGVTVHLPPTAEDHEPLLMLLGNWEKHDDKYIIPHAVKYNAFRWLRDSGFDWEKFIKERKDWQASKQLADGVCKYIRFEAEFPIRNGLGILAFGKKLDPSAALEYDHLVPILSWWAKATVYAIILTCFILGATLVAISRRKMKVQYND